MGATAMALDYIVKPERITIDTALPSWACRAGARGAGPISSIQGHLMPFAVTMTLPMPGRKAADQFGQVCFLHGAGSFVRGEPAHDAVVLLGPPAVPPMSVPI
jgi:hypothetical protein